MNDLSLPDVASQTQATLAPLDRVGMAGIRLPLQVAGQAVQARVEASVSLDTPGVRGIHMSRLYLALEALAGEELTLPALQALLQHFLDSHQGLSLSAHLRVAGELLLKRPALVSPLSGHKAYPFEIALSLDPRGFHVELMLELGYSSTCPCSAALSRQMTQRAFSERFAGQAPTWEALHEWLGSEAAMPATPHSQRSKARLWLRPADPLQAPDWIELVDRCEAALGTALQTAVKRADEQAFALANGHNLMFCEDAARRLAEPLRALPDLAAFKVRVEHEESLHAHDAVAEIHWLWA